MRFFFLFQNIFFFFEAEPKTGKRVLRESVWEGTLVVCAGVWGWFIRLGYARVIVVG